MSELVETLVETPFGVVRGARDTGVHAFHRIPYAEAPVGPKRFALPGAAPRWTGTRDATVIGPVPPQLPSRLDAVMGVFPFAQSEDCLHLDIWTPDPKGEKRPVLVFIHGGAFMTGGGSMACYDGAAIARQTGLVVVTISYRLGLFGFSSHPDLGPGNLGHHDQIAALRWIRQAIEAFGGDPKQVTVSGQSAGAYSIAALLTTAIGRELFDRAILMSTPFGLKLRKSTEISPILPAILKVLGRAPNDLDALRTLPHETLMAALADVQKSRKPEPGDVTPPFMPVIDGDLLPCDPIDAILGGSAAWCPTIIGVTREEFNSFLLADPAQPDFPDDVLAAVFKGKFGDKAEAKLTAGRARRAPSSNRAILADIETAAVFTDPSLAMARAQASFGRDSFVYQFDWQSPKPYLGACHCIDLPFLFGDRTVWPATPMVAGAPERELADLSRVFQGALTRFAATGNPNGTGLPVWPAYANGSVVLHVDRFTEAHRGME